MRALLVTVVLLLVAGCSDLRPQEVPPLQDRGELPRDIPAPAPTDEFGEELPTEPDPSVEIRVTLRDAAGRTVAGATAWIETEDLRDQVHNVGAYVLGRERSLTASDRHGVVTFTVDEPFFFVAVRHPDFLPARIEITKEAGLSQVDAVLRPETGPSRMAHRGASFYAPENTFPSLHKAYWLGAQVVEADVRLTADGRLVIFHDETVHRTTDGTGTVNTMTLRQLQGLDAGAWFHRTFAGTPIPTLEAFLDEAHRLGIQVVLDVKSPPELRAATWRLVLDTIQAMEMEGTASFAAFRQEAVGQCVSRQTIRCILLTKDPAAGDAIVDRAAALGAVMVGINHTLAGASTVERARLQGILLHVGTVNDPARWERMLDLGVDSMNTDRIGYLLDHLNSR